VICRQLEVLNRSIDDYDRRIELLLKQHTIYAIVALLPCGNNSQARLLAALGDDRNRYGSACENAERWQEPFLAIIAYFGS